MADMRNVIVIVLVATFLTLSAVEAFTCYGSTTCPNGGTCIEDDLCACVQGYFSPRCEVCRPIDHCPEVFCSNYYDAKCIRCDGDFGPTFGSAYEKTGDQRRCIKQCSWRSDSNACFPGSCTDAQCTCSSGFSGDDCRTMEEGQAPVMSELRATLLAGTTTQELGRARNDTATLDINGQNFTDVRIHWKCSYQPTGLPNPSVLDGAGQPVYPYIANVSLGVVSASVTATVHLASGGTYTLGSENCPAAGSQDDPATSLVICEYTFDIDGSIWTPSDGDVLTYIVDATNGGYMQLYDRDNSNNIITRYYVGRTVSASANFTFDLDSPYHCVNVSAGCRTTMLDAGDDVTVEADITITWSDWADDLSGIGEYDLQVRQLSGGHGDEMTETFDVPAVYAGAAVSGQTVTLPHPGVYSIVLTASDKSGNTRLSRRFVLFDDDPDDVTTQSHAPLRVLSASTETGYTWVTDLGLPGGTTPITLSWFEHFTNAHHRSQGLLKPIGSYAGGEIDTAYDQNFGLRGRAAIPNALGVTQFRVLYDIDHSGGRTIVNASRNDSDDWRNLNTTTQVTYDLSLVDGDSIRFWVEARDVTGHSLRDTVLTHVDSSPPVVDGGDGTLAVPSSADLDNVGVAFRAYDVHSGIRTIEWRIFINQSDTEVELARQTLPPVKIDPATEDCDPSSCLCIPLGDCYAMYYGFNPDVHIGGHSSDYFVGLTVTNHARLVANKTIKVTVDSTPPEAGVVHDGMLGSKEVDYQVGRDLWAHWEGFVDRESGVAFYRYLFDDLCWDDATAIDSVQDNMTQTSSTHASWTAPSPGKYHVTVVAYNTAQEPSEPVCSDGVTIDASPPELSQIAIKRTRAWPGLAKDAEGRVWLITEHLRKMELVNASSNCSSVATPLTDLSIYPDVTASEARSQQDISCQDFSGFEEKLFLPTHKHMTVSWSGEDLESSIYDYEIGLSSDLSNLTPDLVTFVSTSGHDRFVMYHPHISHGSVFYLVLQAINKAQVSTTKAIGPIVVDTTPPTFVGRVSVRADDDHLIAEWGDDGFIDDEDTGLRYQVAIGQHPGGTETHSYQEEDDLQIGPCLLLTSCAAFSLADLGWHLHGDHEYYVSVRAQNGAGLVAVGISPVYRHIVQLPSVGVVLDVAPLREAPDGTLGVAKDIDVQMDTTSISARWYGFEHPHLDINYEIAVGSEGGTSDISGGLIDVGSATVYRLEGLTLTSLKTYYVTVRATSDTGSVNVTSDGVRVIQEGLILDGTAVKDGLGCHREGDEVLSNGSSAADPPCQDDIPHQSSTSDISARWTIPEMLLPFVTHVFWAVEEEVETYTGKTLGNDEVAMSEWIQVIDYQDLGMAFQHVQAGVRLSDGAHIRSKLKFCHGSVCFLPVTSDGFWVLSRPPEVGQVTVSDVRLADSLTNLSVIFQPFVHEYVRRGDQRELMDWYQWRIAVAGGAVLSAWNLAGDVVIAGETAHFIATYNGQLDRRVCHQLSLRGFNKAGLSSTASTQLPDCAVLSAPNIVIDADYEVVLELNAAWHEPDRDYVLSRTFLAAVWPQLRHRAYVWAAVQDIGTADFGNLDQGLHFPCEHPMAEACGETDKEFVNIPGLSLQHGNRYRVCVHANQVVIEHETWNQTLPSVSSCSDGVVVDTTPPIAGSVRMGWQQRQKFQRSSSELVLHWESFTDSEEHGSSWQHTGIQYYEYAVGSSPGSSDVKEFTRLGLTDSVIVNNLRLEHGHSYYATARAYDFVGLFAASTSESIIVDAMPPTVNTSYTLDIGGSFIRSTTSLSARWEHVFSDKESGIAYYEWAVGSQPGHADVMPFKQETSESGASDPSAPLRLQEGHSYFVTVKAVDHVQLIRSKSFGAFAVDASPPLAGHVFDGDPTQAPVSHRDQDFQGDRAALGASWEGFHDPHSTLVGYSWFAGTCEGCSDVVPRQHVGLDTSVLADNLNLVPGLTYYVTVTACNAAELCTSVTSDGVTVDDSPPVWGHVSDGGPGGGDVSFQSSRRELRAHWWGFHDPHSGLSHYEWRAGTTPEAEDILPSTRIELSEDALIFLPASDQLPVGNDIYITVRAYNRVGLQSEATSNGFRVDPSPPDVVNIPAVDKTVGVAVQNTQVLRDVVRLSWCFRDPESGIKEQYISVGTHPNGDIDIAPVKVAGSERDHTFTNLTLSDGGHYFMTVVACNYAGLCTEAKAEPLLVDTSPPSQGSFSTAANPEPTTSVPGATSPPSHHSGWMTWLEDSSTSTGSLALAWLGFADIHSGISHYLVSVGTTYGGSELTPGGPIPIDHRNGSVPLDDDTLQTAVIPLEGSITALVPPYLYISMWAVNEVGLSSTHLHSAFEASPTSPHEGALVPLQQCSASTCEGHCACPSSNQACSMRPGVCNDVTNSNPNAEIEVLDILNLTFDDDDAEIDINDTATQYLMAAAWRVSDQKGLGIKWSECSIGDDSSTPSDPAGVFDPATEKIWFDVGQANHTVITLAKDHKLTKGTRYYFFVRAWYDADTFAVFRSDGITPDVTPPKVSMTSRFKVKDLTRPDSSRDADYVTNPSIIYIAWEGAFLDDAMSHYEVSLSTYPGGGDVCYFSNHSVPASEFTTSLANLNLHSGQRYYANVRAFNKAGLHTLRSSDGFVVDTQRPYPGVVNDGIDLHDLEYQNTSTVVSASWHGFVDLESYIDHYEWCVGQTSNPTDDSILPCTDVGIHLSASTTLVLPLNEGNRYYSKVAAVDAAGLQSEMISSDGFVVDTSPPEPLEHILLGENLLTNPSFEGMEGPDSVLPWDVELGSEFTVITSEVKAAQDGSRFLSVRGSVSQTFHTLPGSHYQVVLFASHVVPSHNPLLNQEGHIEAPGLNRVFRLYDQPAHGHSEQSLSSIAWHQHRFFFTASGDVSTLKISSLGLSNGILLDNIQVRLVTTAPSTGNGSVEVHTQFIHGWSSLQAKWHFVDPESPIVDYSWAVGTTRGGTQLQRFTSVGTQTDGANTNLSMQHGSRVHVTVTARNAAGLVAVATSGPIIIDSTAPIIHYVIDGGTEQDIDYSSDDQSVTFSWSATDPETGIDHCEWSVGSQPGFADISPISQTPNAASIVTANLAEASVEGESLYATVTCYNRAGQQSTKSSDGITVVTEPPSNTAAFVLINSVSETPYQSREWYQSQRDSLKASWDGFTDPYGIQHYECLLGGPNAFTSWRPCGSTSQTHLDWSGLSLVDDASYTLSVRAVNHAGLTSRAATQTFSVESSWPAVHAPSLLRSSWLGDGTVDLAWDGLFSNPYSSSLVYEVSLGTIPGGSDVMQWVETTETGMRVSPLAPYTDYHLTLTAINAAGLSQTVNKILNNR